MSEQIKAKCEHDRAEWVQSGLAFYYRYRVQIEQPITYCPDCGSKLEKPLPPELSEQEKRDLLEGAKLLADDIEAGRLWMMDPNGKELVRVAKFAQWAKLLLPFILSRIPQGGKE
jgi:hypothetical protein